MIRLGVLGSTNGTDLLPILTAIKDGKTKKGRFLTKKFLKG